MSARRVLACLSCLAVVVFAGSLAGCDYSRLVVVDPDVVASRNARDWTVYREPGGAAPAASTAAAAPPPAAPAPAPAAAGQVPSDEDD
jgi:hypothetical protein